MKRFVFVVWCLGFAGSAAAQTPVSTTQMQLVTSTTFLNRIQYLLTQQAVVVKAEALATVCHGSRSLFANQVITAPAASASAAAVMLAGSTNVIGTVVTNANPLLIDSSASDAALLSQI